MYAYGSASRSPRDKKSLEPSQELRVALTFRGANGGPAPTKFDSPISLASIHRFIPDPLEMDKAIHAFAQAGFRLTQRGRLTASLRCTRAQYEKVFGTKLSKVKLDTKQDYAFYSLYYPEQGAPWNPDSALAGLIDDAYIQWPHIYMAKKKRVRLAAGPSVNPPPVDYFHLVMPHDVPTTLNVAPIHAAGSTGKGIRIVMIDSGFAHTAHPFFAANGYTSTVDLAPHAINDKTDPNGHGTGESTNIFSVAPDATFIGVKVDNDDDPQNGASMLEGIQTAMQHKPHVISVSMGFDLRDKNGQLSELPNSLAALEAEIQAIVASGVVVVFSAGNGHFSFPGMMPDVISAGGVFVDQNGSMQASDYASAFASKIYSGRSVPDFCGLVGMQPHASYIMLPIPPGCEIDRETAAPDDPPGDGTAVDDGWGVFSGTSAAAPQLAGVCALLLEKNPGLTPTDIKALLRRTARDVQVGNANPSSSDDFRTPQQSGPGDDGATGAGLVDAFAAWKQL
jgi:subtilisin family serine protease